jgi:hypothetical protein
MPAGPMGMQDIFRMQQGDPINSNAQNFINPMSAGLKTPQFNGNMSQMSGAVPQGGAGAANPFMAMLQQMQGQGGAAGGQGMMNPLMGQMAGQGGAQGGVAANNPYNQIMDDKFWTYLLQQMFPQKQQ